MSEPAFAHASEVELARILDYYQVGWEYEPRTFPILWNLEGKVVESFTPDFYLPELDLYVELTTLKQSLVRKKNRKLRRLRELYPEIRIKLFYAKDFKALLLKYGRIGVAGSMTGVEGQARRIAAATLEALPDSPVATATPDSPVATATPDSPGATAPPDSPGATALPPPEGPATTPAPVAASPSGQLAADPARRQARRRTRRRATRRP